MSLKRLREKDGLLEAELTAGGADETFIKQLAAAYGEVMGQTQGGGSYKQRGGVCTTFQKKWMKYFVLAVIGGGIIYSGAGASLKLAAKDIARAGSFLWGLMTGQQKCEVSLLGGVYSDLCTHFGVVTSQLRQTSMTSPPAAAAMATGWAAPDA